MKFHNYIAILLLVLLFENSKSQIVLNSNHVYALNHIRVLIICPDSNLMSCPIQTITFDSLGRTTSLQQSMSEYIELYQYDSLGNISLKITGLKNEAFKIDTSCVRKYIYEYHGRHNCKLIKITEHCFDPDTTILVNIDEMNEPGYSHMRILDSGIVEHVVKDMIFPCHSPFTGRHKLKYYYRKDQLIDRIEVTRLSKKGRSQTWYCLYNPY